MGGTLQFRKLQKLAVHNQPLLFSMVSYVTVLAIYINLSVFESFFIGIAASILYVLVNATFLGHAFFNKENPFLRLMFGVLLLIMLLGFAGWLVMIMYNLDAPKFTLVLLIATTLSSLINRRMKNRNAT